MSELRPARILVTGGSGLVGNSLRWVVANQNYPESPKHGSDEWIFLSRADGDLRDLNAVEAIFQKYKPTAVIHLAAKVGGVYANMNEPVEFMRDNLSIDQNILRVSKEFRVEKLISCLSTCIFPDNASYPLEASVLHDGPPHPSNFAYAYAKRMMDVGNRAYNSQYGCNFTAAIPTNLYGPYDNFGPGSHAVPGIIKRLYDAHKANAMAVTNPGSGKPLRQFMYARDFARVLVWMLYNYSSTEPLIVSCDEAEEVSIADMVKLVSEVIGCKAEMRWDQAHADGQVRKTCSNAKMRHLLPDFEFTPLKQGLEETIAWYIGSFETRVDR